MTDHLFISHSGTDGEVFALRLCDALVAGPPSIDVWIDKRHLIPGHDWDDDVADAIRDCRALLFIATKDAVGRNSTCKQEWSRALAYKKPVIPVRVDASVEMPFRLSERQYIDFTPSFEVGLAALRNHVAFIETREGQMQLLRDRQNDCRRELVRATTPTERLRISKDLESLDLQISDLERILATAGDRRTIEEEVHKFAGENSPFSGDVPSYFQDREPEHERIAAFLKSPLLRLMRVVGPSGIGKSALINRSLAILADKSVGVPNFQGIIALNGADTEGITIARISEELIRYSRDQRAPLNETPAFRAIDNSKAFRLLLDRMRKDRILVVIENFEFLVDLQELTINNAEIATILSSVLTQYQCALKVIILTQTDPTDLALSVPFRQSRLEVQPLKLEYAERLLRECDVDGSVGLRDEAPDRLKAACERTGCSPRALEALSCILATDRDISLQDFLDSTENLLPGHVLRKLIGEGLNRLDDEGEKVIQSLAIYGRPVGPAAVEYMLRPFMLLSNLTRILKQLVNMRLTRKEASFYYLQPFERAYALGTVPLGDGPDTVQSSDHVFTLRTLYRRGADYFRESRRVANAALGDLLSEMDEFDLRCAAGDYDEAARLLLAFDEKKLLLRGAYKRLGQLHERLQGKLTDLELQMLSLGRLGTAYFRLGKYREAIACYDKALAIASERNSPLHQAFWLGDLGNCYGELGQTFKAIEFYSSALQIANSLSDAALQATYQISLGNRYFDLGRDTEAVDIWQQALSTFGDSTNFSEERSILFHNLALARIDQGAYDEAIRLSVQGRELARELRSILLQSSHNWAIALASLYQRDLDRARGALHLAEKFDSPQSNQEVSVLLGIIDMRQGDKESAALAFGRAIRQSDEMIASNRFSYKAFDTKGLAECGLALCQGTECTAAEMAFNAARRLNCDAGVVRRVREFLRILFADNQEHPCFTEAAAAATGNGFYHSS